jgi:hypothetical protein
MPQPADPSSLSRCDLEAEVAALRGEVAALKQLVAALRAENARPGFAVTGHTRTGAVPGKPQMSWVFASGAAKSTQKT